jgi:hypothetical protein
MLGFFIFRLSCVEDSLDSVPNAIGHHIVVGVLYDERTGDAASRSKRTASVLVPGPSPPCQSAIVFLYAPRCLDSYLQHLLLDGASGPVAYL